MLSCEDVQDQDKKQPTRYPTKHALIRQNAVIPVRLWTFQHHAFFSHIINGSANLYNHYTNRQLFLFQNMVPSKGLCATPAQFASQMMMRFEWLEDYLQRICDQVEAAEVCCVIVIVCV